MSAKWPMVPLGEVLTERHETPAVDDLASGRVRIVEKIGFNDGCIRLRADGMTKTGMILIRPGDLVVSGINAAKGAIAIYDPDTNDPIAATIHYGAYTPNTERADVRFLWWLLRSRLFQDLLREYVPGGIKTELKAKRLLPVAVPLPPLSEQRRIVAQIENLSRHVRVAIKIRMESSQGASRLVELGIEAKLRPSNARGRVADVLGMKPRSGPSFVTHPEWSGTPVLMPSAVSGFGINLGKVEYGIGTERISIDDRLEPGDILIARGNKREQVGNAGVVPKEVRGWVAANLLMRMRVLPDRADPYFFVYWLRSPTMRSVVADKMSGTNPNILKINQAKILEFPFPTHISVDEQRCIVAELDALQAEVDRLKALQAETAAELDAMLPAILDRAFKGEL